MESAVPPAPEPRRAGRIRLRRRTPPGTAPGTLVNDPAVPAARIHVMRYDRESLTEDDVADATALAAPPARGQITWINVVGLGDADVLQRLGDAFGLHRLALEDVLHVHQRPKAEEYGNQLFIVFRMITGAEAARSEQVSMFVQDNFVITFQERPGDAFEPVRDRLRQGRGIIRTMGTDYLAYALIDATIDHYFPVLEHYDNGLDTLTELVLRHPDPGVVQRLHQVKRELFDLRRIVWATREMVNTLQRGDFPVIGPDVQPYLRDCYDHCIQLMDMLEMQREVGASLFDIYLSSLSNRLNEIMKALTLIATIFIPLGFIASLYGMNFDTKTSPWNMPELAWKYGYPFALIIMLATAIGLVVWFRRRGWLGNAGSRPRRRAKRRRED